MATPAQRTNTWTLDQWYDQSVAGTTGGYVENFTMFMMGTGTEGRLAQNNTTSYSSPRQVPGENWANKTGACGTIGNPGACAAVKTDGTAWVWGMNEHGQLGQNNRTKYSSPRQLGTETTWRSCQQGNRHSLLTKTDGTLWAIGSNTYGSLGQNLPNNNNRSSPVQIGSGTDWSENVWTAQQGRSGATKTDGTMYQWGYADNGTIGNNTNQGVTDTYSSPVQIPGTTWATTLGNTAFTEHNFVMIKSDNTMWGWGYNDTGSLGLNDKTQRSSPTQIPGSYGGVVTFTSWSQVFKNT